MNIIELFLFWLLSFGAPPVEEPVPTPQSSTSTTAADNLDLRTNKNRQRISNGF